MLRKCLRQAGAQRRGIVRVASLVSGRSAVGQCVRRRRSDLGKPRSVAPARGIGVRRNVRTDIKWATSQTDQRGAVCGKFALAVDCSSTSPMGRGRDRSARNGFQCFGDLALAPRGTLRAQSLRLCD